MKGIEDERNFELSTGMKMVMEPTWKYTGVVCRFDEHIKSKSLQHLNYRVMSRYTTKKYTPPLRWWKRFFRFYCLNTENYCGKDLWEKKLLRKMKKSTN